MRSHSVPMVESKIKYKTCFFFLLHTEIEISKVVPCHLWLQCLCIKAGLDCLPSFPFTTRDKTVNNKKGCGEPQMSTSRLPLPHPCARRLWQILCCLWRLKPNRICNPVKDAANPKNIPSPPLRFINAIKQTSGNLSKPELNLWLDKLHGSGNKKHRF